ncbi:S1 family peptidase [Flavivirga spongiicola]|uniref:Serine protease n=1 Tax=Flavivirga spongiicola TaxID=421621 RepID=A0ABU7XMF8_9FLAO|nr:serine protease [Flavivirga sp. MEBiC05379]MDO5981596.1 serine protease [Flavivirga sp. MEBiC05379]
MADSFSNLVQSRTVKIKAGSNIGTGVLIASGWILTCAHVVRATYDSNKSISVIFPGASEDKENVTFSTDEIYISKLYLEPENSVLGSSSEAQLRSKEYPDIAALKLDHTEHPSIQLEPYLAPMTHLEDKQFSAFGFHKKDADLKRQISEEILLIYGGEQVDGITRKLIFKGGPIRHGMSGAGLIERQSGQLIGLVQMTQNPNDDHGAYIIPTEIIWRVFKKWSDDGLNDLFLLLNSKHHKTKIKRQYKKEYPRYPFLRKYGKRVALLAILMLLIIWWVFYHYGLLWKSGVFAVTMLVYGMVNSLLVNWLGRHISEETGDLKTKAGRFFLCTPVLSILTILTILVWTCYASVWIYGKPGSEAIIVRVIHNNNYTDTLRKELDNEGRTRFTLPTNLSGNRIKLMVEGHEVIYDSVKPFSSLKKEYFYPSDFSMEPIALIRFDFEYAKISHRYLINIEIINAPDKTQNRQTVFNNIVLDSTVGSLTIGKRNFIFKEKHLDLWRTKYRAEFPDGTYDEKWSDYWNQTKQLEYAELNLGDTIKVNVVKASNNKNEKFKGSIIINKDNNDLRINME